MGAAGMASVSGFNDKPDEIPGGAETAEGVHCCLCSHCTGNLYEEAHRRLRVSAHLGGGRLPRGYLYKQAYYRVYMSNRRAHRCALMRPGMSASEPGGNARQDAPAASTGWASASTTDRASGPDASAESSPLPPHASTRMVQQPPTPPLAQPRLASGAAAQRLGDGPAVTVAQHWASQPAPPGGAPGHVVDESLMWQQLSKAVRVAAQARATLEEALGSEEVPSPPSALLTSRRTLAVQRALRDARNAMFEVGRRCDCVLPAAAWAARLDAASKGEAREAGPDRPPNLDRPPSPNLFSGDVQCSDAPGLASKALLLLHAHMSIACFLEELEDCRSETMHHNVSAYRHTAALLADALLQYDGVPYPTPYPALMMTAEALSFMQETVVVGASSHIMVATYPACCTSLRAASRMVRFASQVAHEAIQPRVAASLAAATAAATATATAAAAAAAGAMRTSVPEALEGRTRVNPRSNPTTGTAAAASAGGDQRRGDAAAPQLGAQEAQWGSARRALAFILRRKVVRAHFSLLQEAAVAAATTCGQLDCGVVRLSYAAAFRQAYVASAAELARQHHERVRQRDRVTGLQRRQQQREQQRRKGKGQAGAGAADADAAELAGLDAERPLIKALMDLTVAEKLPEIIQWDAGAAEADASASEMQPTPRAPEPGCCDGELRPDSRPVTALEPGLSGRESGGAAAAAAHLDVGTCVQREDLARLLLAACLQRAPGRLKAVGAAALQLAVAAAAAAHLLLLQHHNFLQLHVPKGHQARQLFGSGRLGSRRRHYPLLLLMAESGGETETETETEAHAARDVEAGAVAAGCGRAARGASAAFHLALVPGSRQLDRRISSAQKRLHDPRCRIRVGPSGGIDSTDNGGTETTVCEVAAPDAANGVGGHDTRSGSAACGVSIAGPPGPGADSLEKRLEASLRQYGSATIACEGRVALGAAARAVERAHSSALRRGATLVVLPVLDEKHHQGLVMDGRLLMPDSYVQMRSLPETGDGPPQQQPARGGGDGSAGGSSEGSDSCDERAATAEATDGESRGGDIESHRGSDGDSNDGGGGHGGAVNVAGMKIIIVEEGWRHQRRAAFNRWLCRLLALHVDQYPLLATGCALYDCGSCSPSSTSASPPVPMSATAATAAVESTLEGKARMLDAQRACMRLDALCLTPGTRLSLAVVDVGAPGER